VYGSVDKILCAQQAHTVLRNITFLSIPAAGGFTGRKRLSHIFTRPYMMITEFLSIMDT
jgi:phage gpG-like protein